ncbi:UNVERIFIED_CONTAM: hypothetical protein NCL1_42061 [Trichonephila clavipes]
MAEYLKESPTSAKQIDKLGWHLLKCMKGSQQNIVDESKYNIFLNGRLNINVALFSYTRALGDVILNHGQVTWTTPELSPNSHTTPTGGGFSSRQIERCPTRRVLSGKYNDKNL